MIPDLARNLRPHLSVSIRRCARNIALELKKGEESRGGGERPFEKFRCGDFRFLGWDISLVLLLFNGSIQSQAFDGPQETATGRPSF